MTHFFLVSLPSRAGGLSLGAGFATLLALAFCGCSDSHSPGSGAAGGAPNGGMPGGGRAAGDGGASGSSALCPNAIPVMGQACGALRNCIYHDCAGVGLVSVLCDHQFREVQTAACAATPCGDTSCAPGAVCVTTFATDQTTTRCVSDPCGGGPTGCEYACFANLCAKGLMCYSTTAGLHREVYCEAP